MLLRFFFFFQAEDGIRDHCVTGVQTCALPISRRPFQLLEISRGSCWRLSFVPADRLVEKPAAVESTQPPDRCLSVYRRRSDFVDCHPCSSCWTHTLFAARRLSFA